MNLERIVAPATPLLTLNEVKAVCRVDGEDDNWLLDDLIAAATAYLDARDGVLGEALVTQTWRATYSAAPDGDITLPLGPVQSVVQIRYVDPAGVERTLSSAQYRLAGAVIELVTGASWPAVADRAAAFWVEFVAGYGAPAAVPETTRQLARMLVAEMYDRRMTTGDKDFSPVFKHLLAASRSERGLF
jgi:uncharacterized phiE125 gp8 family phage protein